MTKSQPSPTENHLVAMRASSLGLFNGTYTVSHPEDGGYVVKLYTVANGELRGQRLFSVITGPNNRTHFVPVAYWDPEARLAHVWDRFKSPSSTPKYPVSGFHWDKGWTATEKKIAILLDLALRWDRRGETPPGHPRGYWSGMGYTLRVLGRCSACNRPLTTPESISLGMGPTCASRA